MTFAQSILMIISMILSFMTFVIFIEVVMSWLFMFGILNMRGQIAPQIYHGIRTITGPILQPFRDLQNKLLPNLGTFDLSPILALIAIWWVQNYLINSLLMQAFA
ncbi:hypothetical protein GCM10007853_09100 [Algimonas ampicilliniresistens]|uniref:YggT family protein n=1 Tax=Algimonas ampicilliniresistens TaxID=1298735 RepID=A0ABQ5V677_9PROT|nr:YggT family protein [Algimonas ampicilliniresistens]GLQ23036.1 hypothetical protein GCM10007853_09100 [Algimonas ampicilliniresistens]